MREPILSPQHFRFATPTDAKALLDIYRGAIVGSPISFETVVPEVGEFALRISEIGAKYPWIVCEIAGEIVGYAYASAHRTRQAYDWSAESTVYVKEGHRKLGVAQNLYRRLFALLKTQGMVNVYAGITLPNGASVATHEAAGFRHLGTYTGVGYKLNQWWDVGWWQLHIQSIAHPTPIGPVPKEIPLAP